MNDLSKNNAINSNKIINGINKNEDIGKIEQQLTDEIKIQEIIFNQKLNLIKNKLWFKSDSIIPKTMIQTIILNLLMLAPI